MGPSNTLPRRRVGVALVAATALLAASTGLAAAQVDGTSGTIVVEAGETVDGIDGTAGAVIVRGTVDGDVDALAGEVLIAEGGAVRGGLEAAAGSVTVAGTVDGDASVAAGSVRLTETGSIGGGLDAAGSYVSIAGAVGGDVRAGAETLALASTADVGGDLRYDADEFRRADGASVAGRVIEDASLGENFSPGGIGVGLGLGLDAPGWADAIGGLFANLLLGAVLLVVFPGFSTRIADRVADAPAHSGGVGLLALIAIPLVLVLFAVTIVGIPLAIFGAVAYALAIWIGLVYGQYAVGARVIDRVDRSGRWLALVVGVVGFAVVGLVPILGGLLQFVALLLGLGALFAELRVGYRARRGAGGADPRRGPVDDATDEGTPAA